MNRKENRIFHIMRPFTLIELLVVITIIAILAAILLPSLKTALDRASAIPCMGKLRQMGMLMTAYANDYNNMIPCQKYNPVTGLPSYDHKNLLPALNYTLNGKSPVRQTGSWEKSLFVCNRVPGPKYSPTAENAVGNSYNTINISPHAATESSGIKSFNAIVLPSSKAAIWDGGSGDFIINNNGVGQTGNVFIPGCIVANVVPTFTYATWHRKDLDYYRGRHGFNVNVLFFDGRVQTMPSGGKVSNDFHFNRTHKNNMFQHDKQ